MKKGFFLVIDGSDGSGKTTQVKLLAKALHQKKIPHEIVDFPRYKDNLYGQLVERYLEGEFGGIKNVNPYLMSLAYAGDRMLAKPLIDKWLSEGKLVIANRYVPSNKAHMGANLPPKERAKFIKWLDQLEYETHGIPKEDLVVFLYVPAKIGQQNVDQRDQKRDIHESSLKHLEEANKMYLKLAKMEPHWQVMECTKDGKMKSKEGIHQEIMGILSRLVSPINSSSFRWV